MEGFIASDRESADFVKRKLHELIVLTEMNKEIHSTMNINQLFQILIQKVGVGVNFERCLLYLLSDRSPVGVFLARQCSRAGKCSRKVGRRFQE
ncbi:MAG: hypothetical protein K0B01_08390 [Syntrophobacterales bacterium]|nr:hypothetical protein [Syntrophobacterales bacterium]